MFMPQKEPMTPARTAELWTYLSNWERRLRRNVLLCRIIQPLGTGIFLLNMLLVTMNFILFKGGEFVEEAMSKVPILPALVKNLPRGSTGSVITFSFCFAFLIPLAVSGVVFGILYALELQKKTPIERLYGSEAECAKALAHRAESVYSLRKKLPRWSIFMETSLLTALTAWPILKICLNFASGDEPSVLGVALSCFALLICLFVLFWVFAGLFWIFSKLNALYYFSPSEWKLWSLFNELDEYWESVDVNEYNRREQAAEKRFKESRKK